MTHGELNIITPVSYEYNIVSFSWFVIPAFSATTAPLLLQPVQKHDINLSSR